MNKLSHEQIQQVLEVVPGTLRKLASERDYWKKEAQGRMRHEEAEKVARAMHDKGINVDTPIHSLIESLEKAAEAGNLDRIAEAVDLVGPNMEQKIASLTGDGSTASSNVIANELERFIVGGVG